MAHGGQARDRLNPGAGSPIVRGMHRWILAFVVFVLLGSAALLLGPWLLSGGSGGLSGQVRTSGEALVGGPFTLTDHRGNTFTEKNLEGRYSLIFFGYTYCPDVCPTELQVMSAAIDQLGDTAKDLQFLFVSVDPERDTSDILAQYVENFHPTLVGLTGTAAQVADMAKAYRVYYRKLDAEGGSEDYLMDHSSIAYLMGPDGSFVSHFPYTTDSGKFVAGLKEALDRKS